MNNRLSISVFRRIIITTGIICLVLGSVCAQKGAAFFTQKADVALKKEQHLKAEKLYKKAIQVDKKYLL